MLTKWKSCSLMIFQREVTLLSNLHWTLNNNSSERDMSETQSKWQYFNLKDHKSNVYDPSEP